MRCLTPDSTILSGVSKKSSKTDLFERRLSETSQASNDARPQSQCTNDDEDVSEASDRLNHLQVEEHEDGTPRDSEDEGAEEEEGSSDAESADGSDH